MVFHSVSDEIKAAAQHPVPKRNLVDFARVTIEGGNGTASVQFSLTNSSLAITTQDGSKRVYKGSHTFTFSRGTGEPDDDTTIVVHVS